MKHLLYGRRSLQPLFEKMLTVALGGMNLGNVDFRHNGERWMLSQLRKRGGTTVIFDVGANTGEYAIAALEEAGPGLSVHCFEPSPTAFRILSQRVCGHGSITANNVGLAATDRSTGVLHCHTHGGTGSSLVPKDLPDGQFDYPLREEVALRTLDSYISDAGIDRVDLLKIDVEGLELEVLRGGSNALSSGKIDRIQFEFGEGSVTAGTHFRDFYALLSPNYTLARLVKDGLRPIPRYTVVAEQYATGNYVAVRNELAP